MAMQDESIFRSEELTARPSRWRLRRSRALIFMLITASTAVLLVCPCDYPGRNPHAISLIALSILFGGIAALLIFLEMRHRSDITEFLKVVIAIAVAIAGVYAEFTIAMDLIAWLARNGR